MRATRRVATIRPAPPTAISRVRDRCPLWLRTQRKADGWRRAGCSEYQYRAIRFGIYEKPSRPFVAGEGFVMGEIPQSEEDVVFGLQDLEDGYRAGIYQEVSASVANNAVAQGAIISSAFTVWQEKQEGLKGRFVVNLSKQSTFWPRGTVKMESLAEFAMSVQDRDHFLSMDIYKGYRAFRLHTVMRDWFIFRYQGRFFRSIALPFGWGRSPLWFTQLVAPFVRKLRECGYRVLSYIDDFLVAPSPHGTVATPADCVRARRRIDALMSALGLVRHPTKGEWTGSTCIEHLGVRVHSKAMKFTVVPHKVERVRQLARNIMKDAMIGRRWVKPDKLASFCGTCVSLSLALPWARFYTRSLYTDMSSNRRRDARGRVRLSHQALRDLGFWKRMSGPDMDGRPIHPFTPEASMHTDAADAGFGGTLHDRDLGAGVRGLWCAQGVWDLRSRASSITLRELKAIRLLLTGALGQKIQRLDVNSLLLHVDNQAVVHITNSFVSASSTMMKELRKLKVVLDAMGLQIRTEWIPSVANKFANALSRRFPRDDLQVRRQLRRSVKDGMMAPLDVFPYRPLGDHPRYARAYAFDQLAQPWNRTDGIRLLCPPVDLIGPTLHKLRTSGAPALLMIPDWPRQPWYHEALHLGMLRDRVDASPSDVWSAARKLNPAWRLLLVEVNLSA